MKTRQGDGDRRGFSLLEAVATIVLFAAGVPPALAMLRDASLSRAESTQTTRATFLASAVLEHILADAGSDAPGLEFDAIADSNNYLNNPVTGLRRRMASTSEFYESLGETYTVQIGGLVSVSGEATGDEDRDVFRYVTVTVAWTRARGGTASLTVGAMTAEL